MKKIYTYILMSIALIVFLVMLLMLSPWLNIKNIEINGIDVLDKAEVIRQLKLDKTTNILSFNTIIAKKRLKSNYYVESVKVERKFPDTITINIMERQIVGYIPYINDYLYMDKEGMVVDIKSSYTEAIPIIYGLKFDSFTLGKKLKTDNDEAFSVVMDITNYIKEKEDLEEIVKIDVSNLDDIHLYMKNLDVVLGDSEALSIKINTLNEILKNFSPEEKGFLYIDDINKSPIFKYIT